jgi:hypothetical protein
MRRRASGLFETSAKKREKMVKGQVTPKIVKVLPLERRDCGVTKFTFVESPSPSRFCADKAKE